MLYFSKPKKRHPISRRSRARILEAVEALEPRRLLSVNITINAAQTYQTIEGFGTAIADWTSVANTPAWQQMYYQDLGASQLRINMNEAVLEASPGDHTTPVPMVANLQTDINLMNFTSGAVSNEVPPAAASAQYGLDQVEIIGSLWTPPNWMKGPDPNGNEPYIDSNGNSDGGSLIDTPANLQQFGIYVAAWVKGFEEASGVPMYAISIQNEPTFSEPYDSCVYTPQIYVDALKAVASAFQTYGITTKLEGPELVGVGSVDNQGILQQQMAFINAVEADPVAKKDLNIFSIHGYADDGTTPGRSPTMWGNYWSDISGYGLESWMTETSGEPQTISGALDLAANAQDALVQGNVSAWDYYLTSDGETDYQYNLTVGTQTNTPTYNAAKQFFKYIRPGAVRVSATPSSPTGVYVSAFTDSAQHDLTTVLINLGTTDQTISLNLQNADVNSFTTDVITSPTQNGAILGPVTVTNNVATFTLPAQSIITLQGGTAIITQPPTVTTPAAATPNPVTGTTVSLSVAGTDQGGAGNLIYTWAATNVPPGAASPLFSANQSNAAQDTITTLSAAGSYTFTVTLSDSAGFSTTSSVNVTVAQTVTSVVVTPATVSVAGGGNKQLSATSTDQFGNAMTTQPTFTWSVETGGDGGAVNSSGMYTAPASSGYDIVVASAGGVQGAATITVGSPAAVASPMVYDPFSGSGALSGFSDGTGWAGPWSVQGNNVANPGYQVLAGNSLVYGNLATSGGDLTGGSSYNTAGRALDATGALAAYEDPSTGRIGKVGSSLWVSALMQLDNSSIDGFHLALNASGVAWYDTDPTVAASVVEAGYFGGANLTWSLDVGGEIVRTNVPIVVGQTALVVMHVYFTAAGDTAALYVNPTGLGAAPPAFAQASATATNLEFSNVSFYGGATSGDSALDEIRIGSSYAQVTPNSPPATPTNVAAAPGNAQAVLTWNASPAAASYSISYGSTSGGPYPNTISGITSTAYNLTGLNNGTTYYFVVSAINPYGSSAASSQVSATPQAIITAPNFPSGFSGQASQLDLNGNAEITGSTLFLTTNNTYQAASVYYNSERNITNFTTQFNFQITGTWPIGDGFTFVMQGVGPTALGEDGSGLGYGASSDGGTGGIADSVAVKFDLYHSNGDGATGLYTDGEAPIDNGINYSGSGFNLLSYDPSSATITYNGTTLTVTVTDLKTKATSTQNYTVNIPSIIGGNIAWVGFTGGDGALTSTQDITSWTYTSPPASPSAPSVAQAAAGQITPSATAVNLSVLGSDSGGANNLTYTWSATGPAGVVFSANNSNAAQDSTATLTRAGQYIFTATIINAGGLSTSSSVTVNVGQIVTSIAVNPNSPTLATSSSEQFTATATDQFASAIASPTFVWSVNGSGNSISSGGMLSLGSTAGSFTVAATIGAVQGSIVVTAIVAPAVSSFTVNDGNAQRSMIDSLTIVFSEPVTLAAGAIALNQRSPSGGAPTAQSFNLTNPSNDQKTYVLTFTASGDVGNSLPNGVYDLIVSAAAVTNATGSTLSGGNQTFSFYRMYGDYYGTGSIGFRDLLMVAQNYGATTGQSKYIWYMDINASGTIGLADLLAIAQTYDQTLSVNSYEAPAVSAPAPQPLVSTQQYLQSDDEPSTPADTQATSLDELLA